MILKTTTLLLAVNLLVICAPAAARNGMREDSCSALFSPTPSQAPRGQTMRVYSGPVRTQCGPSCQFESAVSHLQNRYGIDFSSDYLAVARLKSKADRMLRTPTPAMAAELELRTGADQLGPRGNDPDTVYAEIRAASGLIPSAAFKFRPEFEREMMDWAAKEWPTKPSYATPLHVFARRVAEELDILAYGIKHFRTEPMIVADFVSRANSILGDLFKRGLAGLDPKYDPVAFTSRYLPKTLTTEQIRIAADVGRSRAEAADAAIKFITDHLDQGRNVVLGYRLTSDSEPGDRGVIDAAGADQAGLKHYARHSVAIDGYERDANGQVAWFWIKDSQGREFYDDGYQHMPANFVKKYGSRVYALRP